MQKLAQAGVVVGRMRVVPQGCYVLLRSPARDGCRRGQPGGIDVDDRGVGSAQFFTMGVGLGVNLLCEGEPVAARFGEADDFFEPGGTGGLQMDT